MEHLNNITNHLAKKSSISSLDNANPNLKVTSIVINRRKDPNPERKNDHIINLNHENDKNGPFASIVNELIPYPSSYISTVIEKANSPSDRHEKETSPAKIKKNKSFPKLSSITRQSSHETVDGSNYTSHDSCQTSDVCIDKLDISQIVKKLKERTNSSTQTEIKEKCNQYTQVSMLVNNTDENVGLDHQRSNQALRNQIQQLRYIIEEMSKERSDRHIYIHQLQKKIGEYEFKIKDLEKVQEDSIKAEKEFCDLNNLVQTYQQENVLLKNELNDLKKVLDSEKINHRDIPKTIDLSLLKRSEVLLKEDCLELKRQLNALKSGYEYNINEIGDYRKKIEDILRSSSLNNFRYQEHVKLEIATMKNINEQLLHEKGQNIQLNSELESCLNHLKNENKHLKMVNDNLEENISLIRHEYDRLQQEYQNSLNQFNQCQIIINQLNDKLNSQEEKNEICVLKQEKQELKELVTRLEKDNLFLTQKYEESKTLKTNDQQKICLEQIDAKIFELNNQVCSNQTENHHNERDSVQPDTSMENSKFKEKSDDIKQSKDEDVMRGKTMPSSYERSKDDQENTQTLQLNKLIEELYKEKAEYEKTVEHSNRIIQEKDNHIEHLNELIAQNQSDQLIINLEAELSKEKERSKGLSLALIKEKRINSKLEFDLREHSMQNSNNHQINIGQAENTDLLKQELILRIKQLKSLIYQSTSGDPSTSPTESEMNSSKLMIQILKESEELEHSPKTLTNINSSVEDLRQEFNNLKMTFLETYQEYDDNE